MVVVGESDATAVVLIGESVGESVATAVVVVGESDATAVRESDTVHIQRPRPGGVKSVGGKQSEKRGKE